ncbi:MAG: N-acetylmuramoyl-L-alanine amidase, partial [Lachnospiraceae bacterium]|nr:N-acetylmuramoyl-L-alanine amidase [Lachnospiraceae bacterium]
MPGHGGADPGAVSNDRQEKDDTLRLANEVGAI